MSEKKGEGIRQAVLRELEAVSARFPQLRIMQLLGNLKSGDLYYLEDSQLLELLQSYPNTCEYAEKEEE